MRRLVKLLYAGGIPDIYQVVFRQVVFWRGAYTGDQKGLL